MGGGKHQKGGKHGSIGRALAHDILARQARMSEGGYVERAPKHVEQSVFERNSLDEFTMAAQQGLESYLNTHCTTKEVVASDFNSQLARMINYSDVKEYRVFPVVPIPRRCLFFGDEQREIIGKIIKQREREQYVKERRKNKRRNKKLVDMYMHGTGPRPAHGIYEPMKNTGRTRKMVGRFNKNNADDDDDSSEEFSSIDEMSSVVDGSSDEESEFSDVVDEEDEADYVDDDEEAGYVDDDGADLPDSDATIDDSDDDEEATSSTSKHPHRNGIIKGSGGGGGGNKIHSDEVEESDDWEDVDDSGFETEEEIGGGGDDVVGHDHHRHHHHRVTSKDIPAKMSGVNGVSKNKKKEAHPKHVEGGGSGTIKYVEEYRASIKEEIADVNICRINSSELNRIEMKCFYAWRRLLARIEEEEGRVVTPYEKNIEFWRQLWRVVERSHVVLIIVDARDPLFYRVPDLEMYVKEVDERKETMLVLNKADYLSAELRKEWATYFKEKGIDFVFFSTIWGKATGNEAVQPTEPEEETCCRVYDVNMLIAKLNEYRKKQSEVFPELNGPENPENPAYTVGFVGYPNVGKSSLINCLMEVTKTTVSSTPGKTKHFQTLALKKANITLCDCPGLIFPNIVATKHHLLVNSIVSTSHFRGSLIFAVQLICNRIPKQLCERYDVNLAECVIMSKDKRTILFSQKFLEYICHSRKFYAGGKGGQLDIGRAAKLVMKDYVNGSLLYCAWPPTCKQFYARVDNLDEDGEEDDDEDDEQIELASAMSNVKLGHDEKIEIHNELKTPHEMKLAEEKMQQWLMDAAEDLPPTKEKPMTKRKMRFLMKGKRNQRTNKRCEVYT